MIPQIKPLKPIVFKGSILPLKKLYNEGKFPLENGIYGLPLKDVVIIGGKEKVRELGTLEHLMPKSKGGTGHLGNTAIANKFVNEFRGNKPIKTVFNQDAFDEYIEIMRKVKIPYLFDGEDYADKIIKTVRHLLKIGG